MITSIHIHNNNKKFKRLLKSIVKNKNLQINNKLIVVDGSSHKNKCENNEKICDEFSQKQNLLYINQDKWDKIRYFLANKTTLDVRFIRLLYSINLNKNEWNTPEARNVSSVVTLLVSSINDIVLKLDDDMIVTQDLRIPENISKLIGIKITGCPDFSRLEWIQLYSKSLLKLKAKQKNKNGYEYIDKFAQEWKDEEIFSLINQYTNLITPLIWKINKNIHPLIFSQRDELSGGAYLTIVHYLTRAMFPPWYEEDWFWFKSVRKNLDISFVSSGIIHKASKKTILNMSALKKEELGKILTLPLRYTNKLTVEIINEYIHYRIGIMEKYIYLFNQTNFNKDPSGGTFYQVKAVVNYLGKLRDFLVSIDPKQIIYQYHNFKKSETVWINESRKLIGLLTWENINSL